MTRRSHTIRRRTLALKIKELREACGPEMTPQRVAEYLGCDQSKVYRFENPSPRKGSAIKLGDLAILTRIYKIDDVTAAELRNLARTVNKRGRWTGFRSTVPGWFREYVKLETDASQLYEHSDNVIPGLLQSEEYIRAIYRAVRPALTPEQIEDHIKARLERQQLLRVEDSPQFWFIIGEAALRKAVGGASNPHVMRQQIQHLIDVASLPNIEIQIVPFSHGAYTGMATSFTMLRFDDEPETDVAYLEDYTDASYLDDPKDVLAYNVVWKHAQAVALGPDQSLEFLEELV